MYSLSLKLDTQCLTLFKRCTQFESTESLRAVFVTTELAPFADGLPARTDSKEAFVDVVKLFLLEKQLAGGRALMLPFLEALRERHPKQDDLYGELDALYEA